MWPLLPTTEPQNDVHFAYAERLNPAQVMSLGLMNAEVEGGSWRAASADTVYQE